MLLNKYIFFIKNFIIFNSNKFNYEKILLITIINYLLKYFKFYLFFFLKLIKILLNILFDKIKKTT